MSYNPIQDQNKKFTMKEWQKEVKEAIDIYVESFESTSLYNKVPHSFDEWMNNFVRFMSW